MHADSPNIKVSNSVDLNAFLGGALGNNLLFSPNQLNSEASSSLRK